jgi:hypothetical protein
MNNLLPALLANATVLLIGGIALAGNPPAPAPGLWLYEPFGYGDTNHVRGLFGGSGFTGPWKHQLKDGARSPVNPAPTSTGLTYPGLAIGGGALRMEASDAMQISTRSLPPYVRDSFTNGATAYLSFLMQPEGEMHQGILNGYFVAGLIGPNGWIVAGKPGGDRMDRYVLEESGGAGQIASARTPKIGETSLLVMKFEFREGPERVTLFVDPVPGQPEPSTGVVKQDLDLGTPDRLFLYATGAHRIDELRLGSTYSSVVPPAPTSK